MLYMKDRIWSDNNRDHVRSLHILGNMEWIYDRKNFVGLAEIILPSGLVFGNMSNSEFHKPIKPPGDRFSKPPISNPQITTFSVRNNAFNPESRRHPKMVNAYEIISFLDGSSKAQHQGDVRVWKCNLTMHCHVCLLSYLFENCAHVKIEGSCIPKLLRIEEPKKRYLSNSFQTAHCKVSKEYLTSDGQLTENVDDFPD